MKKLNIVGNMIMWLICSIAIIILSTFLYDFLYIMADEIGWSSRGCLLVSLSSVCVMALIECGFTLIIIDIVDEEAKKGKKQKEETK